MRAAACAAAFVGLTAPGSASAATQIGETADPSNSGCGANFTRIQSGSPGNRYAAPSPGVITSWSYLAADNPPQLKLKVARSAGSNAFTIAGESVAESPVPQMLNTYPTRISVGAGDVIGMYMVTGGQCAGSGGGYTDHVKSGDFPPGMTVSGFMPLPNQLDISATLEPDADNDGYGDETQDGCPTNAMDQTDCVAHGTARRQDQEEEGDVRIHLDRTRLDVRMQLRRRVLCTMRLAVD